MGNCAGVKRDETDNIMMDPMAQASRGMLSLKKSKGNDKDHAQEMMNNRSLSSGLKVLAQLQIKRVGAKVEEIRMSVFYGDETKEECELQNLAEFTASPFVSLELPIH